MTSFLLYDKQREVGSLLKEIEIPNGSTLPNQTIQTIDLVIPWGKFEEGITVPFQLNKKAGQLLDNKYEQYKIFKIQGISTPVILDEITGSAKIRSLRYVHIYQIPVFQQNVLAFFRQKQSQSMNWLNKGIFQNQTKENVVLTEIQHLASKREERRVTQLATRAIYALHLDFAMVTIGVTSGEKPWVIRVNPYPQLNQRLSTLFAGAINRFAKQWERITHSPKTDVVLGADTEFALRDSVTGKMVLASTYLPRKGSVGCDDIWTNQNRNQLPLAELRPKPSSSPRNLVINLYQTMLLARKKINNSKVEWLAGAMPFEEFPIGGHIHFSHIELNSFLLRALDNYLALTITLFEGVRGRKRRPKYGFLGDFRVKYHKGFEYRTLPSWIVSPTITKGILALAKLVSENYLFLYQDPLYDPEIQAAYYEGNKAVLKPVVLKLLEEIKQLEQYEGYKKYLDPFEKLIHLDFTWSESSDIRKVWKIPPYHR